MRTKQGKRKMDALREQIAEFQRVEEGLRAGRVQAAHLRWILMGTSCLGLGLGSGIFLALFTRRHVEELGSKLLQRRGTMDCYSGQHWARRL